MDKIKIGEYVRTVDGKIGMFVKYSSRKDNSIYKSPFDCFIRLKNRKSNLQCHSDYIVKHSKNIIDLIEVGDILKIETEEKEMILFGVMRLNDNLFKEILEEIESGELKLLSILTKEQYQQNCYKLEVKDE